jgi:peptide/nickel transport system permease protein
MGSLLLFLFLLFMLVEILIPGDVASLLRLGLTQQEFDQVREGLGLTRPLPVRFWAWFTGFVTGEFSTNSFGVRERDNVFTALPGTALVFTMGLSLAYVIGSWLGRVTAWRPGRASNTITLGGVLAYTAFPAFMAYMLSYAFLEFFHDRRFSWVGNHVLLWARTDLRESHVVTRLTLTFLGAVAIATVVGWVVRTRWKVRPHRLLLAALAISLCVGVWWAFGWGRFAADILFRAAISILAMAALSMGEFLLITQTGMSLAMGEDYVLTANAKGLPGRRVRDDHVGRNAVLTVLSRLAVFLPYLLTGLVVIETAVS